MSFHCLILILPHNEKIINAVSFKKVFTSWSFFLSQRVLGGCLIFRLKMIVYQSSRSKPFFINLWSCDIPKETVFCGWVYRHHFNARYHKNFLLEKFQFRITCIKKEISKSLFIHCIMVVSFDVVFFDL